MSLYQYVWQQRHLIADETTLMTTDILEQKNAASCTEKAQAIDALHAATAIYTAEPVVDRLLDKIDWPRADRRLVDPSCGDGMFIGCALSRLLIAEPTANNDRIAEILEGWEIHPHAAEQSRARIANILSAHGRDIVSAAELAAVIVRNEDFLTNGPSQPRYHVCAGNPPYLRMVHVPDILKDEYRSILPGHACSDLLHSFLDRCAECLMPEGEIALVTSDRWLFNLGASKLRASLGQRLSIHHLERIDVATAFYRPKQRRAGTPPRIHPVTVVMRPHSAQGISLSAAPIYPGNLSADKATGPTLGDVATVKLAPWLGSPGIFVVDADIAASLPPECLMPAVDTDDIQNGILLTPRRYAIRTSPDIEPPPAVMAHLRANLHRMAARGRQKVEWLPPERWHKMALDQPSLLVPRIARTLRPIRLPAGVLPINHNLNIVAGGKYSLEEIEAILCSAEANEWVKSHAAPLESGFYSLTTTLLRTLPTFAA